MEYIVITIIGFNADEYERQINSSYNAGFELFKIKSLPDTLTSRGGSLLIFKRRK